MDLSPTEMEQKSDKKAHQILKDIYINKKKTTQREVQSKFTKTNFKIAFRK